MFAIDKGKGCNKENKEQGNGSLAISYDSPL
jgi:hypothetical protein